MSDFSGVFTILPSWGNQQKKDGEYYSVYIISGPCFGKGVVHQCKSPDEALSRFGVFIKRLRSQYHSEEDYFDALKSMDYGRGACVPTAQISYVTTAFEEVGNVHKQDIEDLIDKAKYVPARKKLRPVQHFNRLVNIKDTAPRKKVFKVNRVS